MKCDLNVSGDSSMSGTTSRFSRKFRLLALVVNTANIINDRTTQTLSISHAILSPITFITTYILLGILAIGACQRRYASDFLQIYSLVSCCSLQTSLSILVFHDLKKRTGKISDRDVGVVLNAVLPMFTIMLIVADLILILFAKRDEMTLPSIGSSHTGLGRAQTRSITIIPKSEVGRKEQPGFTKPATEQYALRIDEPSPPAASTTTESEQPKNLPSEIEKKPELTKPTTEQTLRIDEPVTQTEAAPPTTTNKEPENPNKQ